MSRKLNEMNEKAMFFRQLRAREYFASAKKFKNNLKCESAIFTSADFGYAVAGFLTADIHEEK